MTREEATKWLKTFKGLTGMAELSQAFDIAIKALKQEPIHDILDKIRAEIEQVSFTHSFEYGEYYGEDTRQERIVNFNSVTQIIDKYEESEEDDE